MVKMENLEAFFGVKEVKTWSLWRAAGAELMGTMMLVFIVTSSAIVWIPGNASIVQISLAVGLAVASMAQVLKCTEDRVTLVIKIMKKI